MIYSSHEGGDDCSSSCLRTTRGEARQEQWTAGPRALTARVQVGVCRARDSLINKRLNNGRTLPDPLPVDTRRHSAVSSRTLPHFLQGAGGHGWGTRLLRSAPVILLLGRLMVFAMAR